MYYAHMKARIDPQRNYTTTFPDSFLREIERTAKELQVQKKDLILRAYAFWNKRRKQELLAESYRRVKGSDKAELIETADEGITEWESNIKKS